MARLRGESLGYGWKIHEGRGLAPERRGLSQDWVGPDNTEGSFEGPDLDRQRWGQYLTRVCKGWGLGPPNRAWPSFEKGGPNSRVDRAILWDGEGLSGSERKEA